ncbi:MAG: type II secretion system protein [Candidatus Methylacidiphilales bacterium]|nr:type II secretion system protein [Candidatus Methylacidiphilales bacterium]
MSPVRRNRRAFTLIELLVVITIIGILAGLALPAVNGALNTARKAEAGAMVNQLRTAMVSYQTEYGTWPGLFTGTDASTNSGDTALYNILIGSTSATASDQNPRRIVFMEFNTKVLRSNISSSNKTPDASGTKFVDPWHQAYWIQVDSDYNNQIAVGDNQGTINASVAIWSRGPQKSYDGTDKTKYVTTWK